MGQFGNLVLTTKGLQLQTKAQAGIELAFTRVGFGDGQLTQGQNLVDLTNLINHKITSPITSINIIGDGTTRVRTTLTNKDLIQGFYLREIGLFAQDPDIGEILYAVANAGEYADFLPIGTGNTIVETTLDLITVVGNAANVTAVINESLTYTTVADLNDAFDTVQQKTLKKIIGTFIASENNTTVFTINESDYNPEVDQCELSYKGITLTKDVNYTQSGAEITLLFPINLSEQINYNILKFINNSTIKADGSNLQDKSVTSIKLSQDVQDKVNKVPMIRSQLAGLSSKVSDLTGITPQIAKISRFFLNSKAIVSNQSDNFYANCPNPPLGGVFNNLNSSSGSILASTIDTPATCWALINLLKIYGENNDVATLNRAKLIGNYIVNSIINASFYGAIFRVMPNAYTYASGWTPVTSTIHVRTQYHAMWALLELYKVTGNVTYKNNAIDLMKTIGNIYNNIKARATTQAEISSWMVGAIYNTIHTDGASPTPNMTFSWNVFNHNTADMLSKAIPLYIQQVGNTSINDWEGTAFVPQSIIDSFKTFIQYVYNNKNLTMTPTGLPYSFYEYEDTDAKVNNVYEPKPKNYDWITSGEFGDTWFVNDLTLWTILGIANLGLMDIATRYRNAFMKLQISSYPDKVLFHDRYNFDGTSLIDDQSISICATALLYAVDKTLGIVDDELHSVMNDTLLGYQIQSTNLNIDGSYRWDIADSAASIEVKATSEICYNSSFIVGGGVIDSITSQLAEKAADTDNNRTTTSKTVTGAINELNINKAEKTEINSLATAKADITYVDTKVATVASGSPDKTYATLTDLNTAYPTGDSKNKLVASNGHIYNWSGTAWEDTGIQYQSTGIASHSVTPDRLTAIREQEVEFIQLSSQLIDYTKVTNTIGRLSGTGTLDTTQTTFCTTSDFIPIIAEKSIVAGYKLGSTQINNLCFYDANKVFISMVSGWTNTGTSIVIPSNACYCKFSYTNGTVDVANIGLFYDTVGSDYSFYKKLKSDIPVSKINPNVATTDTLQEKTVNASRTDFIESSAQIIDYINTLVSTGRINATNGTIDTSNNSFLTTDFIPVINSKIIRTMYTNNGNNTIQVNNLSFYDFNKNFISAITGWISHDAPITVPDKACYLRFSFASSYTLNYFGIFYNSVGTNFVFYKRLKSDIKLGDWKGKNLITYGDSITAIGNNQTDNSWQNYIKDYFSFANHYSRGIGGQSFVWNNKPWFANADGSYNSRDDNGDMTNSASYTIPSGCTAHYGAFCSWDRIKTMFSDAIKDTIDLIFVMGSTNDAYDTTDFSYSASNTVDSAWINATENEFKGDFNINTLKGAIASTIIKIQARCPNAVLVFGTPCSGRGTTTGADAYSFVGDEYSKAQAIKEVCSKFSIPVIDVYSTVGINPFNRATYISDTVHPFTTEGKKAVAKAVIGGLKNIEPKLITLKMW